MVENGSEARGYFASPFSTGEEKMSGIISAEDRVEIAAIAKRESTTSWGNFLRSRGVDISDEAVAATKFYHRAWQGGDDRRSERDAAKVAREAVAAKAKADRDAKKREALLKKKADLAAALAALDTDAAEDGDTEDGDE